MNYTWHIALCIACIYRAALGDLEKRSSAFPDGCASDEERGMCAECAGIPPGARMPLDACCNIGLVKYYCEKCLVDIDSCISGSGSEEERADTSDSFEDPKLGGFDLEKRYGTLFMSGRHKKYGTLFFGKRQPEKRWGQVWGSWGRKHYLPKFFDGMKWRGN